MLDTKTSLNSIIFKPIQSKKQNFEIFFIKIITDEKFEK